ncbi:hypothetical protein [uncultured Desulfosarcina sp.]|uniref:hypothetical protein n=1 Tax=uncultured Desulfosarcina sp. TaxID=218289 RepID=UPI0029C642B7|nr:hypothetical protein [uncultured Desulfosarcina sp.]
MDKDYLLGLFRTQKNNYRLAYVLIALSSQDDVMDDFLHLYKNIDPKFKVIDGIEPLILDKKVLKIAVDQFHMTILRAVVKELFEVIKIYCKDTKQNNLLHSQSWYQLWRIIRNCFSHDFHFHFNNHDKKFLPISWNGVEIREDMDGKQMTIGHFSYEKLWALINEVEAFIETDLA